MSARTGLGAMEVAVLAAVAEVGGQPEASHVRTTAVLDVLDRDHGFGPRYAYPLLQDLAAPWRLHLPLLEGWGNWGSQSGDRAADARYTEVRLSRVGALALAAEQGEVGPVPLGLIEGSLYRDGPVPPFAPLRVLEALTIGELDAGPPVLPTGGNVEGEVEALLAGRAARLTLGCTIVHEPGQLVITEVPFGVAVDEVAQQLETRVAASGGRRYADYLPSDMDLADGLEASPVRDVRNETSGRTSIRIVCTLSPGAGVAQARDWIRSVWPVTIEVDCRLPAPMRQRIEAWDPGDGTGLTALATLL